MRAVWFGLVASVLALGGAQAAECRAGHMALKAGAKTFSVAKASYSSREGGEVSSERVVLVGRIKRAPYVVDIQAVQGNSASFVSYEGSEPDEGLPPQWGAPLKTLQDGSELGIMTGPMRGEWRVVCR